MTLRYKQEITRTTHRRKALPSLGNQLSCSRALPTPLAHAHTFINMRTQPSFTFAHIHTYTWMHTHYTERERERERERKRGRGTSTVQCQQYFIFLNWDEPEEPSGLLAPRANTKASVHWASKYSVLLLRQPVQIQPVTWNSDPPLPLLPFVPNGPSFSHQSFIWE